MCEACDQRIPVLGHGMVCKGEQYLEPVTGCALTGNAYIVCGYTCHEECHKNIKKCLGPYIRRRPTSPDVSKLQVMSFDPRLLEKSDSFYSRLQ